MTLTRYFTRAFAGRFLAVIFAFASLLQLLDLLDKASQLLKRGQGMGGLATYFALQFPLFISQLVPMAVLIGALLAFMGLAQHNEIVALRAAGASPLRLFRILVPTAILVAVAHFLLIDQVAPRAERALQDWWISITPPEERKTPERYWMHTESSVLSFRRVEEDGRLLRGVVVVQLDERGVARDRIAAREAAWEEGGWVLRGVDTLTLRGTTQLTASSEALAWPNGPTPENVLLVSTPTEFLSLDRLSAIIAGTWSGTRNRAFYQMQFQKAFAVPATSILMLLLAQPALHGIRRSSAFGAGVALGLVLGLIFLVFQGLMASLAEAGVLPPFLAAWVPLAIFFCIGIALILHLEE
ncbi:LPS export ABC transporter permease LptG [Azospirillum sp. SYSU D00513]|uniref:LPS export ABC transporter permease LptG n=1 Tax=Azospirillum sp. SYSU D00513 TaxID=2812561 RepID=UPI001A973EC9|nr:LPS export ABC transporter permease LptG [Azospirillum sp. SYSU D00513]